MNHARKPVRDLVSDSIPPHRAMQRLEPKASAIPADYRGKHAIIGAGFSGLGVAAAFTRGGTAFDILECSDDLGGNWYHGVYESVHIISSRKTTEYPDWPMPSHWPDFPSAAQMLMYLRGYAEHWQLRPHISFGTRIVHVEPAPGQDGCWLVTLDRSGAIETRVYGGVVVANGHHWDKKWPHYPGTFTGEMIHSKDYKTSAVLAGKRVLVIGGGNSSCDIAVEAARVARGSHISMRRGYWFLPKTMLGVPSAELVRPWMPVGLQRVLLKSLVRLIVGPYQNYGLCEPDHELFNRHPTINSELLYQLRHGRITPHPDISRWDGDVVEFVDGAKEPFDLVVCGTGYHTSFPMLAPGLVNFDVHGMPQLIAGMNPEHKNLYVFGLGQPRYGAGPLISAGADLLHTMVETQKSLSSPLGAVLQRLGVKAPRSDLQDPFAILRQVRFGKRLLPRLPALEGWIMRSSQRPPPLTRHESASIRRAVQNEAHSSHA